MASTLQEAAKSLVICARDGKPADQFMQQIAEASIEALQKELHDDSAKLAFWINLYNGSVQNILMAHPELFEDRGSFFKAKQIEVAGRMLSLDDIEHGMIRKSKLKLSLGYLGKLFVKSFEKKLRVKNIDPRIHFALNCGAKSCPPVAIYDPQKVFTQLEMSSEKYLTETTKYFPEKKEVEITVLFSWFRGDFGGLKGVRKMLKSYQLIPEDSKPDLKFADYDWTLSTGNFITL
ncbi:MAG TPA: DUF547 domain-containing protein [Saprospiraceae bacterium]|nr:DUF547 domain-containing protein [Saprospiraceae bacterium]HMQ82731.1 DUF547 domain-containing protein [Saprospiraceae bacterium]